MTELYSLENSTVGPLIDQIQLNTDEAIAAKRARQLEGIKRSKTKYYQSIRKSLSSSRV